MSEEQKASERVAEKMRGNGDSRCSECQGFFDACTDPFRPCTGHVVSAGTFLPFSRSHLERVSVTCPTSQSQLGAKPGFKASLPGVHSTFWLLSPTDRAQGIYESHRVLCHKPWELGKKSI